MTASHHGRIGDWEPDELKAHLASLVDALEAEQPTKTSPLDIALLLLNGELDAFVLFGRMGHLDPPRADGKFQVAILQHKSEDPAVDNGIRDVIARWATDEGDQN